MSRSLLGMVADILLGASAKALPNPARLAMPGGNIGVYPLTFPGWEILEAAGLSRDERNVRKAMQSGWVMACIDAIAKEMASAELAVYKRTGPRKGNEEIENHPLELLWESPNPFMGRSYLVRQYALQLLFTGRAYLFFAPVAGKLTEVWPVPSTMIAPIPDPVKFIGGYLFRSGPAAEPLRIRPENIVYSRLPHPLDLRDGLSPLASIWPDIEGEIAMANWNRSFFSNENATPEGLISLKVDALDEDLERVRTEMRDFYANGQRRVAVARAGDLDWKPFGRSQREMEFLEGRRFSGAHIMRAYGIPEGYFAKDATRANAEGAKATMIEAAVWPHLVSLAEDMNAQLVRIFYGADLRVEFRDIRPRNRAAELQEWTTYAAALPVNELREKIDLDPLPDDDPRGYMLVAEISKGAPIPGTKAAELIAAAEAAAQPAAPAGADPSLPPASLEELEPEPGVADEGMPPAEIDEAGPPMPPDPADVAALEGAKMFDWGAPPPRPAPLRAAPGDAAATKAYLAGARERWGAHAHALAQQSGDPQPAILEALTGWATEGEASQQVQAAHLEGAGWLKAARERTAAELRDAGVARVVLYRADTQPGALVGDSWDVPPDLTSWTWDAALATGAAKGMPDGVVVRLVAPAQWVVSTARTGLGSAEAGEYVIAAEPGARAEVVIVGGGDLE